MQQIGVYFKKFEGLGRDEQVVKNNLIQAIIEVVDGCSVGDIDVKNIKIKKDKIEVCIYGPLKNEISLYKNKIQILFEKKNADKNIKNKKII
jgi:hypothetical protein